MASSPALTPQQRKVMTFVLNFRTKHRVSPTYDEIGRGIHIGKPTVMGHVVELERHGYVKRTKFRARSLEILQIPSVCADVPAAAGLVGQLSLSPKQLALLDWLIVFMAEHDFSPTLEEIGAAFGRTKVTILGHLRELERRGCVERENSRPRSIKVLYHPPPVSSRR